ncbi:cytochrome c-type biogenesis protein [Wolbachia endosymbiont of Chironomus riparius]|uniref:cytochrome c-type biogenesis protein n=1 Tax=Wolbachia endosymbiont of Chironomus riparius TaxID=2883238 RepID=UPI00209C7CF8|nr:cytochrome c-type biogenesis protein CcmH [Wolbachia endosymbiont of Chironomus riparius]
MILLTKLINLLKMREAIKLLIILIIYTEVNTFVLDDKLEDANMEKRAIDLFKIIKCPICSGETLSESAAHDIRKAIRNKINDGYTDQQIISELKGIYGNSIIIVPPIRVVLIFYGIYH